MDCKAVQANLDPYLEQALPDNLRSDLEAHLHQCDRCWQELAALQELHLILNAPDTRDFVMNDLSPLPDDFTDQVMARVEAERPTGVNLVWPWLRQRWSRRQYASVAYAMSATMAVVTAGNLIYLWTQSTMLLSLWLNRIETYWQVAGAYVAIPLAYVQSLWQTLASLMGIA